MATVFWAVEYDDAALKPAVFGLLTASHRLRIEKGAV
jgi:hypothetical protein